MPLDVITALYESDPREWLVGPMTQAAVVDRFAMGGMPTLRSIVDSRERSRRANDYVEDLFSGDVYETGRNRSGIIRLFRFLAATSGGIENFAKYQDGTQLSKEAVIGYLDALRTVYLLDDIPAYSRVPGTRETDRPRSVVLDPMFVASQVGGDSAETLLDVQRAGPFMETIVAQEVQRLLGWSSTDAKLHHWRRNDKDEVDLLLERNDGMVVAIEVKSKRSVTNRDAVGIEAFRSQYPDRFLRGFVVHPGDVVLPLAENIWALPISALWIIGESVAQPTESPLSFQQRLERAVASVRQEAGLIPVEEVLTRQRQLVESLPLVHKRLDAIAAALFRFEVTTRISPVGRKDWIAHWDSPQALQGDQLFSNHLAFDILKDAKRIGSVKVSISLIDETVQWDVDGSELVQDIVSASVTSAWNVSQTAALDELFGSLADVLPEIVRRYREAK